MMEEMSTDLLDLIRSLSLIEKSIRQFHQSFASYQEESYAEFLLHFPNFNQESLIVKVDNVSYVIDWPNGDDGRIKIRLLIFYLQKEAGRYEIIFSLSGNILDDFLLTYSDKDI